MQTIRGAKLETLNEGRSIKCSLAQFARRRFPIYQQVSCPPLLSKTLSKLKHFQLTEIRHLSKLRHFIPCRYKNHVDGW